MEIKDFIDKNPDRVSPSVVSRPLLQSWLLPTLVYIAGPAEIAYWAQIEGLFNDLGLNRTVVIPRISATILEAKAVRYANNYMINLETIDYRFKRYFETYWKKSMTDKNFKEISTLKDITEKKFIKIDQFLQELDPTLLAVSSKKLQKIKNNIKDLENKILQVLENKEKTVTRQLKELYHMIYPNNKIQERSINIIYFINKYGIKIIKQLIDGLELNNFNHQLYKL
jgi:uncharacterized protein YllA (UPF0747 family)